MTDVLTSKKRSELMSKIRSKDTQSEIIVRKFLFAHGLRYRKNDPRLPGKPDIVLPKFKTVIFVHGCFWHGHENCSLGRLPKSKVEYWRKKIENNKLRDRRVIEQLEAEGWHCLIVWHCQLRTKKAASVSLPDLLKKINSICKDWSGK
jgi:DNA mismatch endonuclease (patch repair protein)